MKNIQPIVTDVAGKYQYHQAPNFVLKLQELIADILRAIHDLLNSLHIYMPITNSDSTAAATILRYCVYIAAALCLGVLIYLGVSRLNKISKQKAFAKAASGEVEIVLTADGWRKQAETFAKAGKWRESCRALYLSILNFMDERGVLEFMHTRTNYEYCYALKKHAALEADFRKLVDIVEYIWFGKQLASEGDYQSCLSLVSEMETLIQAIPTATPAYEGAVTNA